MQALDELSNSSRNFFSASARSFLLNRLCKSILGISGNNSLQYLNFCCAISTLLQTTRIFLSSFNVCLIIEIVSSNEEHLCIRCLSNVSSTSFGNVLKYVRFLPPSSNKIFFCNTEGIVALPTWILQLSFNNA